MAKYNKKITFNTLSCSLNDFLEGTELIITNIEASIASIPSIDNFLSKVDKRRRITLADVDKSYDEILTIFKVVASCTSDGDSKEIKEAIVLSYDELIKSISPFEPGTYDYNGFSNEIYQKNYTDEEITDIKKKYIYIKNENKLQDYCLSLRGFLKFKEFFSTKWNEDLKRFKDLDKTIHDVIKCQQTRNIITDDMRDYLFKALDSILGGWRKRWDLDKIIEVYNQNIEEQRRNKERVIANRNLNFVIEETPKLENGYKLRIDELINYYDINKAKDLVDLSDEKFEFIKKYTLTNDLNINSTDIIELDSLLYVNQDLLLKSLFQYKETKMKLFLNLLIRTYVIKKMPSQLEFLLSNKDDFELACFDPKEYLNSVNRETEAQLIIKYIQYIGTLKALNNQDLETFKNEYEDLKMLVYLFSKKLYDEKDYLKEIGEYVRLIDEHMTQTCGNFDEEITEINPVKNNTVYLLTDNDGISFAEKDILNDIKNVNEQANAFDRVLRFENIDVHNIKPHKFKTDFYDEKLLKSLNFKSAYFKDSRVYFGYFTNSNREPLVIIYGARTGSMDSNSMYDYFKEVMDDHVYPNRDKIMDIIASFNNDPEKFNKYIAESENAKDHFNEILKENGYKFKTVNTLEME